MFERKLKALDYIDWDKVNGNDVQHFRKLVTWLEDQKIRHYRIEDRKELRDINSENWPQTFAKYCSDVACPITTCPLDQLEWLLGFAIRLEFEDDHKNYQQATGNKAKNKQEAAVPCVKSSNPLDNLDFESNDFKNGVNVIAKILQVPQHPNHLITLEACSKIVCKRLNPSALENPNSVIVKGKAFPILEADLGFDMGDKVLNTAAKILRLLYIHDIRDLQTKINEAIVSVQNITANPKTDTKLGKVGI
ncbi:RNA transcription, translation and transport factor protein [Cephus cinctus]|uniref:RNA transcription, translation and transport factor protein n=1 Tax=Cephus cinctus TaxID=211228 RepID=A0AAJ7FFI6_CEPCN|nr:RNA transcription, translation and transport factor protein [Cephus cinctus]XP_015589268.1 RNA transcription, translation and transport factor protein [Cephus cinctus]